MHLSQIQGAILVASLLQVHRTTVYRTNHQSDWAVTLHSSWEEVRSTVGHFSSVSQLVVAETLGRR